MSLKHFVDEYGGVIPSRVLIEAGFSYRDLRALCASGEAQRLRQGWLATPGSDAALRTAALCAGTLTCVTQAKRLGLWVTASQSAMHLAMRPNGRKPAHKGTLHLHWNTPVIRRDPRRLEDGVVNVLANVALCVPMEEAMATWESALKQELVTTTELRRLPFTGRARELASTVTPFADSGLETIVVRRLRRLGLTIRVQSWILGHHVDVLIGDRLVLQIDGGTHVGVQRTSDISHDARLMLNGYHVIRVGYVQVMESWHEVQDLILQAVAQGLAEVTHNGDVNHAGGKGTDRP